MSCWVPIFLQIVQLHLREGRELPGPGTPDLDPESSYPSKMVV